MTNKPTGKPAATANGAENLQFAALPYQVDRRGSVKILLVTSRETARWIIPKGWPMKGKMPHEAAAIEAFEEAGVVGEPKTRAIGSYQYWKREALVSKLCRVDVYPLPIDRLEESWLEEAQRERQFFAVEVAASLVEEPSLKELINAFRVPKMSAKRR
jgi:8-oxo-dGTP pyrophosphatase MutT (NUDIX family)